jgi:hypothetical protein
MKARLLLLFLALLGLGSALGAAPATPATKPNILFILADDLGFAELGCNGSDR